MCDSFSLNKTTIFDNIAPIKNTLRKAETEGRRDGRTEERKDEGDGNTEGRRDSPKFAESTNPTIVRIQ